MAAIENSLSLYSLQPSVCSDKILEDDASSVEAVADTDSFLLFFGVDWTTNM